MRQKSVREEIKISSKTNIYIYIYIFVTRGINRFSAELVNNLKMEYSRDSSIEEREKIDEKLLVV